MRFTQLAAVVSVLACAAPAAAQETFGLGVRMAMIRTDLQTDPSTAAERFFGGHLRARISPRASVELSLDRRSESSPDLTQRVVDYPLQGSVLFFPLHTTVSPYLLGGAGWYTHVVQTLASSGEVAERSGVRKMGYHGGFGAEMRVGRHAGVHADYRYTFIHFADATGTSSGTVGLASRFRPSYDGSMWTAGVTFYF